ncbi:MAG: hypothetical protein P4L76_04910 [Beijerinckiaceae bacterium]|nr:hypothetical protein [Beijerinckiaceae bacterium]
MTPTRKRSASAETWLPKSLARRGLVFVTPNEKSRIAAIWQELTGGE